MFTARYSQSLLRTLLLITLFSLISACSLAEDVTPPPGYVPPVPTATPAPSFPQSKPSLPKGAEVYAQNCTRCHGVSGKADGEMVSQINVPVPAFANPDLAFTTTPARWFDIITNGNIQRLMPPWGSTLSESDRWSVIAHLYSLSVTPDQLKTGQSLYAANCQQCHGASGAGDGPQATGTLPNFTDQAYMAAKSNQEFVQALAQPPHTTVASKLSAADQWAVVDYVRSLSFDTQAPEVAKGMVTGKVTNGTPGSTVPAGQSVELRIFDNFQEQTPLTTTLKPDGSFEFDNLDLPDGRAFVVTSRYQNVLYTSEAKPIAPDTATYDLPVTIYETTTDPAQVTIDRLHIVFDFQPGVVQVGELIDISNGGTKAYIGATAGGPTLQMPLPSGYSALTFQDGQIGDRYQQTADGFADTTPIAPGADVRQILLSYKLPYTDSLTISRVLAYPVGTLDVLVPDVGVSASGTGLIDKGLSDIQGSKFHSYSFENLKSNAPFSFTLSGQPSTPSTSASNTSTSTAFGTFNWRNLLIGLLSLALVGAIVAYWWTGRTEGGLDRTDALLQTLAQLDGDYAAGKLKEDRYQTRRSALKAELRPLLEKKHQSDQQAD